MDGLGRPLTLSVSDQTSRLFASVTTALFMGLVFSSFANHDLFHAAMRKIGVTVETSYPSEWFGEFLCNVTYIVLQLTDGRRLYGWPREWPSNPEEGYFVIEQPSWLFGDDQTELTGVSSMLVSVNDVEWVEFMEKSWELDREESF